MKLSKNTIVSILLLLFLVGFSFPLKAEKDIFYIHYGSGNYAGAMATVNSDFLRTNDDALRAVQLLRIYEAARFPEDTPNAIEYLKKLSEKIDKKSNLELFSLYHTILMKLYQNIDDRSKLFHV